MQQLHFQQVLREFKRLLEGLKIPRLMVQNDSYEKNPTEDKANSYELQLNCCILLDKPLEKILIRSVYDILLLIFEK